MSTTLTLRRGMEYMKRRRDEQTKQDKWDYYNSEYIRLRDRLYEKEYEKELNEFEHAGSSYQ
jgi:hypothetical protein